MDRHWHDFLQIYPARFESKFGPLSVLKSNGSKETLWLVSLNLSRILNPALNHSHAIFTIPGQLARLMFVLRFQPEILNKFAALFYSRQLRKAGGNLNDEWLPGILTTLHKSGNSLHVKSAHGFLRTKCATSRAPQAVRVLAEKSGAASRPSEPGIPPSECWSFKPADPENQKNASALQWIFSTDSGVLVMPAACKNTSLFKNCFS